MENLAWFRLPYIQPLLQSLGPNFVLMGPARQTWKSRQLQVMSLLCSCQTQKPWRNNYLEKEDTGGCSFYDINSTDKWVSASPSTVRKSVICYLGGVGTELRRSLGMVWKWKFIFGNTNQETMFSLKLSYENRKKNHTYDKLY